MERMQERRSVGSVLDSGSRASTPVVERAPTRSAAELISRAAAGPGPTIGPSTRVTPSADAVIRRKKGKGKGQGKGKGKGQGKGKGKGKGNGTGTGNGQPTRGPVPLTAEELERRAQEEQRRAEEEAARKAEEERVAAEVLAARKARGLRLWNGVTAKLWADTPQEIKTKKDSTGKLLFSRKPLTALMVSAIADEHAYLTGGEFDDTLTDEALVDLEAIGAEWTEFLWGELGRSLGTNVPTKTAMWAHLGWPNVKGLAWDLEQAGTAASGARVHLTVSGNSMRAPQTVVESDPDILQKSPAAIFDALFLIPEHNNRVHCTLETNPKKHLYLGGKNGGTPTKAPWAIAETDWGGDAKHMHAVLKRFRADTEAKIFTAKLAGWKV